jgi:hypothetical protein
MALKTARINIYIYTGQPGTYTSNDLKYRLTKDVIGTQQKVVSEIGELVRDYIENTYEGESKSVWVNTNVALYNELGNELQSSPVNNTYLAVDGYGNFEEGINPDFGNHVMQSNDIVYIPEGTQASIPVFAESLSDITFYNGSTNIGSQTIADSGHSNQKIQTVYPPTNCTRVVFDGPDERIIKIEKVCEPVFTPYKVKFINKFGAHQNFWFFKKNTKKLSINDKTFRSNSLNIASENYSLSQGQESRFNVTAQSSISMNTGFVSESTNEAIEQMLMSEQIWIDYEGQALSIIPKSKSLTYKTDVNDKLINYSFDFEFAFDKFNLIR